MWTHNTGLSVRFLHVSFVSKKPVDRYLSISFYDVGLGDLH